MKTDIEKQSIEVIRCTDEHIDETDEVHTHLLILPGFTNFK